MTGYGRSAIETNFGRLVVEVKTVNHKYRQLSPRIPSQLSQFEPAIGELIKSRIARGQIYLTVELISGEKAVFPKHVVVDLELARQYKTHLDLLRKTLGIDDSVPLSLISSLPGVMELVEPELDAEEMWRWLELGLNEALNALERARIDEGDRMRSEISDRLSSISESLNRIKSASRNGVEERRRKLEDKIKEILGNGYDESRIVMEAAIMAERSDISEEIVRMESHIGQLSKLLDSDEPVGRQMDFLLQEMLREATTMASKATSAKIVSETVRMRSEIDKMREIAQNVE
jgi:uncharacterized protein (TIGR00255 family)